MCRKYLDIDMMSQNKIDWTNTEERLSFENDLNRYRKDKQKRSYCEKVAWFILVFISIPFETTTIVFVGNAASAMTTKKGMKPKTIATMVPT